MYDWTLIIFQDSLTLHYLMSTLFFFFLKKKKFFFGCTSTQITLKFFHVSYESHVSAMLNFKFFWGRAMCWHSTLTLIQIGMHECGMNVDMLDWTLAFLIQIYFVTFWLFILLVRWKQVFKRAHLLAVSLAKACSFTTTCWYLPACFGNLF